MACLDGSTFGFLAFGLVGYLDEFAFATGLVLGVLLAFQNGVGRRFHVQLNRTDRVVVPGIT